LWDIALTLKKNSADRRRIMNENFAECKRNGANGKVKTFAIIPKGIYPHDSLNICQLGAGDN